MNDYERIKNDILWILKNYYFSQNINRVIAHIEPTFIGNRRKMVKENNYIEIYKGIIDEGNYDLLLIDESIINFSYCLNEEKKIVSFSVTYMPCLLIEDDKYEQISKYIRFDFSPQDHKLIEHTSCHMHVGLLNEDFRIPIQTLLYPIDIIYIILKYVYKEDSEFIGKIELISKDDILSQEEKNKLRLIIG